MRMTYEKPMAAIELFALNQPVARDCNTSIPPENLTLADPGACAYDPGNGFTIFTQTNICMIDGSDMEAIYGCYNNPGEGNYIFRS